MNFFVSGETKNISLSVSKTPICGLLISPIKKNETGNLINQISKETVHLDHMWSLGQPNGHEIQQCIQFYASTGEFNDASCSYKTCFVCEWIREPVFFLRGLYKNSEVDEKYVLMPDMTYDDNLFFYGFELTNIIFKKNMNSWLIVADLMVELIKPEGLKEPSKIVGAFQPDKFGNQMPIGRHTWNLTTADCNGMVPLKFTSVGL